MRSKTFREDNGILPLHRENKELNASRCWIWLLVGNHPIVDSPFLSSNYLISVVPNEATRINLRCGAAILNNSNLYIYRLLFSWRQSNSFSKSKNDQWQVNEQRLVHPATLSMEWGAIVFFGVEQRTRILTYCKLLHYGIWWWILLIVLASMATTFMIQRRWRVICIFP